MGIFNTLHARRILFSLQRAVGEGSGRGRGGGGVGKEIILFIIIYSLLKRGIPSYKLFVDEDYHLPHAV